MNTPAHAIANLLLLGRRQDRRELVAVTAGSLLPDMPIIWFYFQEKVLRGTPEMEIWRESYYREGWQVFFDLFNSLPILGLLVAAAWWLEGHRCAARPGRDGSRPLGLLFASMAVHAVCDLPLHNDDGHRHFWPLSDWRFESPISYWDPAHYGLWVALAEIALVLVGSIWLYRFYQHRWGRILVALIGASYLIYIGYVLVVWV